jgi:hypothetical protein
VIVAGLVVFALAGWGWAVLSLLTVARAYRELRANRLELVSQRVRADEEQAAKETALELLDAMTQQRETDLRALTARLDALQARYARARGRAPDIDGPLASKRLQ